MGTVQPGTPVYENNAAFLLETAPNLRRCAEHPPPATPPVPALLPPKHRSLPGPTAGPATRHEPSAEQLCFC